jgi:D-alanine transfer protein
MAETNRDITHVFAAGIAVAVTAAVLLAARAVAIERERGAVTAFAPLSFQIKNQGLAFQRAAAHAPDVLPVYGSSELTIGPVEEKGGYFFRTAPTGFQISPVGNPGMASLIILQKVAALAPDLRGKKVVVSLSSSWFVAPSLRPYWYNGTFSLFAANEMVFASPLDFKLKRDIAARMLQFPGTLEKSPLLKFALECLASGRWIDRVLFDALWPLGKVQRAILDLQDHHATVNYIRQKLSPALPLHPEVLDWPKLLAEAEGQTGGATEQASDSTKRLAPGSHDDPFIDRVNTAGEWVDLELLLRTLAQIHAQPLLISVPLDGPYYDQTGVTRAAREVYYRKMRTFARRYNLTLIDFPDHDSDPTFLDRSRTHLTGKGWLFYDRVLDDFYHGRIPLT